MSSKERDQLDTTRWPEKKEEGQRKPGTRKNLKNINVKWKDVQTVAMDRATVGLRL